MAGLTAKQRRFIDEYFNCNLNATQAAREAGYKHPNKQGPRLLVNVGVQAEIAARLAKLPVMSADEVLTRLGEQARGSMADFVQVLPGGIAMLDLEKAEAANKLHLVKKFKVTRTGIEIELYDAQSALVSMGKYHALFTERIQVDDWRAQAIADIRAGIIPFEALAEAFDHDLAEELFSLAGVPISKQT